MKKHSSGAGAMFTKTESCGVETNSLLQELRSPGDVVNEASRIYNRA